MTKGMTTLMFCTLLLSSALTPVTNAADQDRRQQIQSVLYNNGYRDIPSDCLDEILEVEKRASRHFNAAELVWSATSYMESKGWQLPRRRCFTCKMEVLTPSGYRRIDQLAVGDEVMSWDDDLKELVTNRISAVHRAENVAYGELTEHGGSDHSFEVTPDHPFFLPEKSSYASISEIGPNENLLFVLQGTSRCETTLLARGPFVRKGTSSVITVSLERKPNNFIVNGIVVQNKPGPIT